MRIPLDRSQPIPLYLQIEEFLRRAILDGVLPAESKLPATRTLAASLQVSRLTIENAYAELTSKGLIRQRHGSGTYVCNQAKQLAPALSPGSSLPWHRFTTQPSRLDGHPDEPLPAGVIDFASGIGDHRLFPLDEFRKIMQSVLQRHGEEACGYGDYCGYYPLRDTIARILSQQGIACRAEQLLITSGSQQAISLITQHYVRPGDTVVVESPTYAEALALFAAQGAQILAIPGDDEGMQVDRLAEQLAQRRPSLIYTIPNFQNPTGRTMSLRRRQQLVALAEQYQIPLLEDDFVGDLRYSGSALPALRALSPTAPVIYVGTFSKILMPGMRIGYLQTDGETYQALATRMHLHHFTCSSLIQRTLDAFVTVGRYEKQLKRICRRYRQQRDLMVELLHQQLPAGCRLDSPEGGLFIWLQLPEGYDLEPLIPLAWQRGVLFARGECFYPADETRPRAALRLNFATNNLDEIRLGVARLCQALRDAH